MLHPQRASYDAYDPRSCVGRIRPGFRTGQTTSDLHRRTFLSFPHRFYTVFAHAHRFCDARGRSGSAETVIRRLSHMFCCRAAPISQRTSCPAAIPCTHDISMTISGHAEQRHQVALHTGAAVGVPSHVGGAAKNPEASKTPRIKATKSWG